MGDFFTLKSGDLIRGDCFGVALGDTKPNTQSVVIPINTTVSKSDNIITDGSDIKGLGLKIANVKNNPVGNLTLKVLSSDKIDYLNNNLITDESKNNHPVIINGNVQKLTYDPFVSGDINYNVLDFGSRSIVKGSSSALTELISYTMNFFATTRGGAVVQPKSSATSINDSGYSNFRSRITKGTIPTTYLNINQSNPDPNNIFKFSCLIGIDGAFLSENLSNKEIARIFSFCDLNSIYIQQDGNIGYTNSNLQFYFNSQPIGISVGNTFNWYNFEYVMDGTSGTLVEERLVPTSSFAYYATPNIRVNLTIDGWSTNFLMGHSSSLSTLKEFIASSPSYQYPLGFYWFTKLNTTNACKIKFLNCKITNGRYFIGQTLGSIDALRSLFIKKPGFISYHPDRTSINTSSKKDYNTSFSSYGNYVGSIGLIGTNNYLTITNSLCLNISSRQYLIDGWLYFNSLPSQEMVIFEKINENNNVLSPYKLSINQSGILTFKATTTAASTTPDINLVATNDIQINRWNHFAISKNSNNTFLYLNGFPLASAVNSTELLSTNGNLIIGQSGLSISQNYYLSDFRFELNISSKTSNPNIIRNFNGSFIDIFPFTNTGNWSKTLSTTNTSFILNSKILKNVISSETELTSLTRPISTLNIYSSIDNFHNKTYQNYNIFDLNTPLKLEKNSNILISVNTTTTNELSSINKSFVINDTSVYRNNIKGIEGNVEIDNLTQSVGDKSIKFYNSGKILLPNNKIYEIGSYSFCIESYVYLNSYGGDVLKYGDTSLIINNNGSFNFKAGNIDLTSNKTIPLNTWQHICILSDSTRTTLFLQGISANSMVDINPVINSKNDVITYPNLSIGDSNFNGNIQHLKIHIGTHKYSSTTQASLQSISPTKSTTTNTVLAIDVVAGNGLESFILTNNGLSSTTITKNKHTLSANNPFFGSGSMYLSGGANQGIIIPSNPSENLFNFNENPFTIEFWVNPSVIGTSDRRILTLGVNYIVFINATGNLCFTNTTDGGTTRPAVYTGDILSINTWYHVAIIYDGLEFYYYLNGSKKYFNNYTKAVFNSATINVSNPKNIILGINTDYGNLTIGSTPFNGFIGDIKISKLSYYSGDTITVPNSSLSLNSFGTFLFKHPYNSYEYTSYPDNIHIGGKTTQKIDISASNVALAMGNLYIQTSGNLVTDYNSSVGLYAKSDNGVQINPIGSLSIGTSSNNVLPIYNHILKGRFIDVNNFANFYTYGAYKISNTSLQNNVIANNITNNFTVKDSISNNWRVGDLLAYTSTTKNVNTNTSLLNITSFNSVNSFTTNKNNTFSHLISAEVPNIINLSRNVIIDNSKETYSLTNSGPIYAATTTPKQIIRVSPNSIVDINNTRFLYLSTLTFNPQKSASIVSNFNIKLSGNAFNDDGAFDNEFIDIYNYQNSNILLDSNVFHKSGNSAILLSSINNSTVNLNNNILLQCNVKVLTAEDPLTISNCNNSVINLKNNYLLNSYTNGARLNSPITNCDKLVSYNNEGNGLLINNTFSGKDILTDTNQLNGIIVNASNTQSLNVNNLSSSNNTLNGILLSGARINANLTNINLISNSRNGLESTLLSSNISGGNIVSNTNCGISAIFTGTNNITNLNILSSGSIGLSGNSSSTTTLNLSSLNFNNNRGNILLTNMNSIMRNISANNSITNPDSIKIINNNNLLTTLENISAINNLGCGISILSSNSILNNVLTRNNTKDGLLIQTSNLSTTLNLVSSLSNTENGVNILSTSSILNEINVSFNKREGINIQSNLLTTSLDTISSGFNTFNGVNILSTNPIIKNVITNNNILDGINIASCSGINIDKLSSFNNTLKGVELINILDHKLSIRDTISNSNSAEGIFYNNLNVNNIITNPLNVDLNNVRANSNKSFGIQMYSIIGRLSNITVSDNYQAGLITSIGNGETIINGITATTTPKLTAGPILKTFGVQILSCYSFSPLVINKAQLSATTTSTNSSDAVALYLSAQKLNNFSLHNSDLSGGIGLALDVVGGVFEGSQNYNNTRIVPDIFTVGTNPLSSRYQTYSVKETGISFVNRNKTVDTHTTYYSHGIVTKDNVIFNKAKPSERLTPNSTFLKLRSGSKFVALSANQTVNVSVNVRVSRSSDVGGAYNGSNPRLILKRNPSAGYGTDLVLAELNVQTTANIGQFITINGDTPYPSTSNIILEFYVDCDGTNGFVNIEDWNLI